VLNSDTIRSMILQNTTGRPRPYCPSAGLAFLSRNSRFPAGSSPTTRTAPRDLPSPFRA